MNNLSESGRKSAKKNKISKEKLLEVYLKKKACESKALKIVESLTETGITREYFKNVLNFINLSHFDDIMEERFINKLCGYPLCNEVLVCVPNQQYIILSNTNKVYDITERKKFCSSRCFKSSQYLRQQIMSTPLWLRDNEHLEEEESKFTFLDEVSSETGN